MSTLRERVAEALAEAGMSQAELARAAGVKTPSVNNWISGATREMKAATAHAAALALGVNAAWLATGVGPKRRTEEQANQPDCNVSAAPIGTRRVPLISYVQAGDMTAVVDAYEVGDAADWLLTDLDLGPHAFALQIKGESMLPTFRPGDRIIVDPAVHPIPGDFVVAKNGEHEATFKKYRPRGVNEAGQQVFELVPLNDDYPTVRSDITPLTIIGTMVEHRTYRR